MDPLQCCSNLGDPEIVGVYDGQLEHHRVRELVDGRQKFTLQLPVRIRVKFPQALLEAAGDDEYELYCRFSGGGSCRVKSISTETSLWAPPGDCRVIVSGGPQPGLNFKWNVEVSQDQVIELSVPTTLGILSFTKSTSSRTEANERERYTTPSWLLIKSDNNRVVNVFNPWPQDKPTELFVPAGDYELRVAFGPSAVNPIRFNISKGARTEVRLPFPESLPCNGSIALPLPEGISGKIFVDVTWAPTTSGHTNQGDHISYTQQSRVVGDQLFVHGLVVGEEMKLELQFDCYNGVDFSTRTAEISAITLTRSTPTDVAIVWQRVED